MDYEKAEAIVSRTMDYNGQRNITEESVVAYTAVVPDTESTERTPAEDGVEKREHRGNSLW